MVYNNKDEAETSTQKKHKSITNIGGIICLRGIAVTKFYHCKSKNKRATLEKGSVLSKINNEWYEHLMKFDQKKKNVKKQKKGKTKKNMHATDKPDRRKKS